jgi:hypothetical protein
MKSTTDPLQVKVFFSMDEPQQKYMKYAGTELD